MIMSKTGLKICLAWNKTKLWEIYEKNVLLLVWYTLFYPRIYRMGALWPTSTSLPLKNSQPFPKIKNKIQFCFEITFLFFFLHFCFLYTFIEYIYIYIYHFSYIFLYSFLQFFCFLFLFFSIFCCLPFDAFKINFTCYILQLKDVRFIFFVCLKYSFVCFLHINIYIYIYNFCVCCFFVVVSFILHTFIICNTPDLLFLKFCVFFFKLSK